MIIVDDLNAEQLTAMGQEERKDIFDGFIKAYAKSLDTTSLSLKSGMYNPSLGQDFTQSVSSRSSAPTQSEIEKYLKRPDKYGANLRQISNYFEDTIMQYKRAADHFKKILTFRYDLRLTQDYEEDEFETVKNSRNRCNLFLRDFGVPYHSKMIFDKSITNGGGFFYLKKNEDFYTLIEMPIDYCYITGNWDRGFTYAVDLTWFDKYQGMKDAVPEMYDYYELFLEAKRINSPKKNKLQYYPVPIERGFVFTFGVNDTYMVPPLTGTFRDANAIFTYKNLLMQRTALETWKVVAQKIPLNKDDVPILSGEQAQIFVDFAQSVLPSGTAVFATPMEIHEVDFSNGASSQNNITGMGEELYWRSVGVNGSLMDASDKSSATMRYSLMNDEGFVDSIYQQMSDFINLQLRLISRKFRFTVKFYGNRYLEEEQLKTYKDVITTMNGPVGKAYALMGYEPFEVTSNLKLENDLGIKDMMKPIISGYQQNSDNDDNSKEIEELTDSGLQTRDDDLNQNREGS